MFVPDFAHIPSANMLATKSKTNDLERAENIFFGLPSPSVFRDSLGGQKNPKPPRGMEEQKAGACWRLQPLGTSSYKDGND